MMRREEQNGCVCSVNPHESAATGRIGLHPGGYLLKYLFDNDAHVKYQGSFLIFGS